MNVLIVEDEPLLALDLEDMLQGLGHQVIGVAGSAVEAEALLASQAPDLVLIDINIRGDRNGIAVAHAVRAAGDARIAFATAHADQHNLALMAELDPVGVMTKPYDHQRLAEILNRARQAA